MLHILIADSAPKLNIIQIFVHNPEHSTVSLVKVMPQFLRNTILANAAYNPTG